MPFIPTAQPREQADVPNVPQARLRAPQVDLGGVSSAAGRLAGASQQAETPLEPFLAPGRGLQQVGQGLDAVGNVLAQLASARAQAKNDLDLAESQTALDMAFADMEKVKQTTSPDRWEEEWSTRKTAALEQVFNNDRLSPIARQRLQVLAKRWEGETSVRVAQDSTIEIGRRAADAWQTTFQRALDTGDLERAAAINQNANPVYVPESAKYQNEQAIAGKRDEIKYNAYYDAIQQDARGMREILKTRPDGMSATMHAKLVDAAKEVDKENVAADVDRLENAIVTGAIKVPAEVDTWEQDNPRITPAMRDAARGSIIRRNDATARANIEANAPTLASRYYAEAKNFDWNRDGEEAYWNLRMRINELPAPLQGEVSGVLEKKFPGRQPLPDPTPETQKLTNETLTSMFNGGLFGSFDHGTGMDKDGKPAIGDAAGEVYKRNRGDYEKALKNMATVGGKMRVWLQANPNATPEDAQKQLYKFASDEMLAAFFDKLDEVKPITPAPMDTTPGTTAGNDELPSNPGPAENILLPPSSTE
jgi:hypothetical protein